jgi:nucleoredoxin
MQGQAVVPINELPPDLQKQLNYNPAAALAAANQRKQKEGVTAAVAQQQEAPPVVQKAIESVSQGAGFPSRFSGSLVTLQGGDLTPFDASHLRNVKYWAFYYSASWCPPCRAFTPKLVQFYATFKSQHPNFELIFVNEDHSESDMVAYMKNDGMTWPAVRYGDIGLVNATQYCGSGIPDLVLLNSDGKVLSDSFSGSEYLGPEKVMDDIPRMVTAN